jgi:hypothetical protein
LLFIASNAILCFYGFFLGIIALYGVAVDNSLFDAKFKVPNSEILIEPGLTIIMKVI